VLLSLHAPVHELDLVGRHVIREGLAARMKAWRQDSGASELVYLATCQRVLWMLWNGDPSKLKGVESALRYEGEAAWQHLLGLAAGLESANLGDREIPDQMKEALAQAREIGAAGEEAHAALEDVVREGQRLRSRLGMADGSVSVATAALRHLSEALPAGASVVVVGMGPMSLYLAERLPERGFKVSLANRTQARADEFAEELGLETVPLARLQRDPEGFDALVTATGSPRPLFTLEAWGGLPKRPSLRILDLALPADSEPGLEQLPWVHRVDLSVFLAETASARAQRAEAAVRAEPILAGAAERLRRRALMRAKKRELRESQDRLNGSWDALEREALGGKLSNLSDEQKAVIRELLQRGRTLAHRALIQGGRPEEHLANVAEILQLGAS
ncbi:MAG TPA: NAD(P)-binding domain-containing protein, partial [Holophagaceae bacterium]|nr:NAD(P)-binding domain-containing protein [Holophagaceae bacterium]